MDVNLEHSLALLDRTPATLTALLSGLPEGWLHANEGEGTWSPFDVLGHLVDGERVNWLPRLRVILEHGEAGTFAPFDRFAHLNANGHRSVDDLLAEFTRLRGENVAAVRALHLTPADLARTGRHPEFGPVTLGQLIATWTAHDLAHLVQVSRTMARTYRDAVGPWRAYLSVMG
ncbi:DinB family protein [Deinococcus ficus]|jgi:hypothetical protein|uniref:DinB-like domain-containing protein n=1 Tax=Deinococcus ficus TaxID=317577 RepID=A0A221STD6_9DEIO|nr:DinB family protein [Deinococcus ficus]ASN79908.1 hypothetical protein DFI_01825 [Deinococcus ficus]